MIWDRIDPDRYPELCRILDAFDEVWGEGEEES